MCGGRFTTVGTARETDAAICRPSSVCRAAVANPAQLTNRSSRCSAIPRSRTASIAGCSCRATTSASHSKRRDSSGSVETSLFGRCPINGHNPLRRRDLRNQMHAGDAGQGREGNPHTRRDTTDQRRTRQPLSVVRPHPDLPSPPACQDIRHRAVFLGYRCLLRGGASTPPATCAVLPNRGLGQ